MWIIEEQLEGTFLILEPLRIEELQVAITLLNDKALSGYAEYLSELVKDTPKIKAGGKLDPEVSKD